jgi:hypothetical protein
MKKEYFYLCGCVENDVEEFMLEENTKYTAKDLKSNGIVFYTDIPEYEYQTYTNKISVHSLKYENLDDLILDYLVIASLPELKEKYEDFDLMDMFQEICIVIKKDIDGNFILVDSQTLSNSFNSVFHELAEDMKLQIDIDFQPFYDVLSKAIGNYKKASIKFFHPDDVDNYVVNVEKKKNKITLNGNKKNTKIAEEALLKDMFLGTYECLLFVLTDQKVNDINFNEIYKFSLSVDDEDKVIIKNVSAKELQKVLVLTKQKDYNPEDYNIICDLNGERIF